MKTGIRCKDTYHKEKVDYLCRFDEIGQGIDRGGEAPKPLWVIVEPQRNVQIAGELVLRKAAPIDRVPSLFERDDGLFMIVHAVKRAVVNKRAQHGPEHSKADFCQHSPKQRSVPEKGDKQENGKRCKQRVNADRYPHKEAEHSGKDYCAKNQHPAQRGLFSKAGVSVF